MEERQDNTRNIKLLRATLKEEKIKELINEVKQSQVKANAISKKLGEKEAELRRAAIANATAEVAVSPAESKPEKVKKAVKESAIKQETPVIQPVKEESASATPKKAAAKTSKKTEEKVKEKVEVKTQDPVEEKPAKQAEPKVEAKPEEKAEKVKEKVEVKTQDPVEEKPAKQAESKVEAKPKEKAEKAEEKVEQPAEPPKKSILSFIVRKADPKAEEKARRESAERKAELQRAEREERRAQRAAQQGDKPYQPKQQGAYGQRPGSAPAVGGAPRAPMGKRPQEIAFVPPKDNKPVKKKAERNYEEKHSVSKKSLIKELTVADFDENKTGYRKVRKPKQQKKEEQTNFIKIEKAVITKELTPIKELSEKFGISAVEITKRLFKEGIMKTVNDSIDFDTAAFIAADLGIEVEQKMEKSAEDLMNEGFMEDKDDVAKLQKRPPIVTVMGHVDHGKTSLLDRIRSANVAEGEAGGITQHIGAYSVDVHGSKITFIDTPGHAAFTAMRARGAQVTDIAIIVVAADDGIMTQTIEAINHAKAAGVSIIVAANKIDKPHVDLDRVRQQLSEHELLVEEWGGDTMMVPVSAKSGQGMDKLMESILLVAEMAELKANPERKARGTVIEAKLDKGKGPLATVLVQNGTLRVGDNVVAGTVVGRIRAMINDKGATVKEAGPSTAVSVLGLEDVPNAGDAIFAVDEEKLSKLVAQERKNKEREEMIRRQQKITLDDLFSKISDGQLKTLNIIVKADVQGSSEAVKQSLAELSNDEVKISIIHAGVGAINETDVTLAESSNAIIIGFNVRPDAKAKVYAERSHIDVKLYRVIYAAIEDIKKAMSGMLAPKYTEVYTGKAEVRETFKISGVGTVAGCHVTDGKIIRQAKLRIYRNDVMICEGNVLQLKRFKDDVKEVNQGYECGISIEGFNDIKIGDFIESYIVEEKK